MVFEFIKFSTSIDYVGQRRTEKLFQIVLSLFATIGFIWGFVFQQFSHTLLILAAGVVVSSLLVLPPWPFWRKNPLKWQKPIEKVDSSSAANPPKPVGAKPIAKDSPAAKRADPKKK